MKENSKQLRELDRSHAKLEKSLDNFRKELYKIGEPTVQHVEPVEFDELGNMVKPLKDLQISCSGEKSTPDLPPMGKFEHTRLQVNDSVYAMRSSLLAPWAKARVLRVTILFM